MKVVRVLLRHAVLLFGFSAVIGAQPEAPAVAPRLAKGIAQVEAGDYQAGLATLDGVVRDLAPNETSRVRDLADAHLYRGVAYVGLRQEEKAKEDFRAALRLDPLILLPRSPQIPRAAEVFQAAHKGKGSRTPLYVGGVVGVGAVATGALLLAGGGEEDRVTETFSGTTERISGNRCVDIRWNRFQSGEGRVDVVLTQAQTSQTVLVTVSADDLSPSEGRVISQALAVGQTATGQAPAPGSYGYEVETAACSAPYAYTLTITHPRL